MSTVTILFGTESGNSEMVADDVCDALQAAGLEAEVWAMESADIQALATQDLVVVISSTYGEGELPATALDFHAQLEQTRPDLSGLRFAAFGLGDSTYDTYNRGIAALVGTFTGLGATRVGEIGFHDADTGLDPGEVAVSWVTGLVEQGALEPVHV